MPQLVKPHTYSSGSVISSTQVNANEDAIINTLNALDEDNFDPSTQIPNSMLAEIQPDIVDAHADDAAEFLTAVTPGSSASPSLPAHLTDELERIRYRVLGNNHLISTYYMGSDGLIKDAGWVESAPFGPQLFSNNGFETKTSATASDAPDGWTLVGTPTSLVITAPGLASPTAGKYKKAIRITCSGAAGEGIQQTLYGMKASTKYLIGMTFAKFSGTPQLKIETTNGLASGAYQNLAVTTSTSATISHVQAIVQTTSTGTDLTVKFTNTAAATDVFDLYQVWAYEIKDSTNLGLAQIPMQTASDSTSRDLPSTFTASQWNYETWTQMSLSQYVPAMGYRMIYDVAISALSSGTGNNIHRHSFSIKLDGNIVQGPLIKYTEYSSGTPEVGDIIMLSHVVENPAPGATYAFTVEVGAYNTGSASSQVTLNPLLNGLQAVSRARLRLERL